MRIPEKFPSLGFAACNLNLVHVIVLDIWYMLTTSLTWSFWNAQYVGKTAIRSCLHSNGDIFLICGFLFPDDGGGGGCNQYSAEYS